MKLNSLNIKKAKAKDKPYKMFDGEGLHLLIKPNGRKYWRLKYRVAGKEKLLSLGVYPDIELKEVRTKAREAKETIKGGGDPSAIKQLEKLQRYREAEDSFKAVSLLWLSNNGHWSESHRERVRKTLENDVFPHIGSRPIADITPPEVLSVVRRVESRGRLM